MKRLCGECLPIFIICNLSARIVANNINVNRNHLQCQAAYVGPENAHLKPGLGAFSHNEMTFTLNNLIPLLTCLHLSSFRSQAAIVSKTFIVFTFAHVKASFQN